MIPYFFEAFTPFPVEVQQCPGVTQVDIDLDPPDFFGSYDLAATSESDGEDRVISTAVWDTNAIPANLCDDGDPNEDPDLQRSGRTASQRFSNPHPTGIARTDSQRNFDRYQEDSLKAIRRASSSATTVTTKGLRQPPDRPAPRRQVASFLSWSET